MAADQSIQSLDRGLQVLRLLSRTPVMTATAIAAELRVHQSSASRLLNSLLKAGFVRKPDFHSFSLDYGALAFAGHALNCFPEIKACTETCNHIRNRYGFGAAAGILREGRVLYLTQTSDNAAISILDDTEFPLHLSTIGLVLCCEKESGEALDLIAESILRWNRGQTISASEADLRQQAGMIYTQALENIRFHGYLHQTNSPQNAVNGAQAFSLNHERAALAVYHPTRPAPVGDMRQMLAEAVGRISAFLKAM